MKCDQCAAAMINGVFCHERGCPNERKAWDRHSQEWHRVYECGECGAKYFDSCDARECCSEQDFFDDSVTH